jgi:hypothetical protein
VHAIVGNIDIIGRDAFCGFAVGHNSADKSPGNDAPAANDKKKVTNNIEKELNH